MMFSSTVFSYASLNGLHDFPTVDLQHQVRVTDDELRKNSADIHHEPVGVVVVSINSVNFQCASALMRTEAFVDWRTNSKYDGTSSERDDLPCAA